MGDSGLLVRSHCRTENQLPNSLSQSDTGQYFQLVPQVRWEPGIPPAMRGSRHTFGHTGVASSAGLDGGVVR